MKTWKWAIAAIIAFCFVFTGCSDGSNEVTKDVLVGGITLDQDELVLGVGDTEDLTVIVMPFNATLNKTVTWKSSNTDVATVTVNATTDVATVTAVADGFALITVTANGRTATCIVIVTPDPPIPGAVAAVILDKEELLLLAGGNTKILTATVLPSDATNKSVTWSSSDTGVATVFNGTVRGVAIGNATITVSTTDGGKTATCSVTVTAGMPEIPDMVWIEPGTFMMGSPLTEPESYDDENPRQVTLTQGFYMAQYAVTVAQFEELMGFNSSLFSSEDPAEYGLESWDDCPVDTIWYDAIEYCNLLSEEEGLTPVYTRIGAKIICDWEADGYRLPTEAEWEYACRAGTTTPFNTGDTIVSGLPEDGGQANFDGYWAQYNGADEGVYLEYPLPVGSYEPNAWGLYDMHGNINEWCWDWFLSHRSTATGALTETDPKGPEEGWRKVYRGGSWYDFAVDIRSAFRGYDNPDDPLPIIGFRVVRNAPSSTPASKLAINARSVSVQSQELKVLPQKSIRDKNASSSVKPQSLRRKAVLE
jgi:formylglycine-generating enzyme required for sulfatase activity